MSEIQIHQGSSLALDAEQTYWNEAQLAALQHMGVERANPGDLQVFHHVCTRTGLDPFARQIYMIGRNTRENIGGEWVTVTKYTIQTGIDGFRLIGRRAADRAHHSVSVSAPEWAHEDGSWRPVWMKVWGFPVAARVIIKRGGEPFEAVALFDEYKQTKRDGELTQMWAQRPAGQIAKCAEALAWRMAFPQDLSGIYADEEMAQADNQVVEQQQPRQSGLAAALAPETVDGQVVPEPSDAGGAPGGAPTSDGSEPTTPASESGMLNTSSKLAKAMYAAINEAGIPEAERIAFLGNVIGREISSSKEMTEDEARDVLAFIEAEKLGGQS